MRDGSLTARETELLSDDATDVSASAISLWELRIKWNLFHVSGDRKGPADPAQVLTALSRIDIPVIALSPEHAAASLNTPMGHRDPFDELLLIQAQEMDGRLLTRDAKLANHPLALQL
ncbi:MAG: hypothetical protein E7773_10750 [Sphingomonas sp.]|nr:PIN domain-containing protein [Sphingomonas sp.]THD35584.1 MAG: hypothetical protein E7773_10750 [Sphingomonas sp.]